MVRLIASFNGGAVTLHAEVLNGEVVALLGDNLTAQACRFTLDRPSGDTHSVRLGPNRSGRRNLQTPIAIDAARDDLEAGTTLTLAHPVP